MLELDFRPHIFMLIVRLLKSFSTRFKFLPCQYLLTQFQHFFFPSRFIEHHKRHHTIYTLYNDFTIRVKNSPVGRQPQTNKQTNPKTLIFCGLYVKKGTILKGVIYQTTILNSTLNLLPPYYRMCKILSCIPIPNEVLMQNLTSGMTCTLHIAFPLKRVLKNSTHNICT